MRETSVTVQGFRLHSQKLDSDQILTDDVIYYYIILAATDFLFGVLRVSHSCGIF